VEDRVDLHRGGKIELIGMGGNLLEDSEFPQTLEVEFRGWASCLDIAAEQPYLVFYFQFR